MDKKICSKCGIEKSISNFQKNKRMKDGMDNWCKLCRNCYARNRINNLSAEEKEKRLEKKRKFHWENREKILETKRKYNLNNVENHRKASMEYYYKNKDKVRKYKNNYEKERKEKDISYKLRINLRARIREAIKNNGTKKSYSTIFLIGCEVDYLRQHLESQFKTGMSWSNYGEWEIDHIQPCSSFDLTNEQQQKECFHYTNLQPLWKNENRIKGARTA